VEDLRAHPASLEDRIREFRVRPFDLCEPPLIRFKVLRLSESEALLLRCVHHIVADAWSIGVLHRELFEYYRAFRNGRKPDLEDLTVQYPDFSIWQRRYLQGHRLQQHLDFWRSELEGYRDLALPTDRPRPEKPTHAGAREELRLEASTARRLAEFSKLVILRNRDLWEDHAYHAGEEESSCMLHLRPDLVRREALGPRPVVQPELTCLRDGTVQFVRPWHRYLPESAGGDASRASAEKGRRALESGVAELARVLGEISAAPDTDAFPYP
jgi:hypothetical protein